VTWFLAAFLAVHGLLHLAIWMPPAPSPDEHRAPFAPDRSALLTASKVEQTTVHVWAVRLAVAAAASYLGAAILLATGSDWALGAAALAATVGLILKTVYFHPWLTMGVVIDGLVLTTALLEWPTALG
jgi:hypothetical protein